MDIKEKLRSNPLRIGVSTRALFDLEDEHAIFDKEGVDAYVQHQLKHEADILEKGTGFPVIERLLGLNESGKKPFVEVILLSRNSPDLSLRAFKSIEEHGLEIKHGSFTSGKPIAPFTEAWGIDLFLSNEGGDVQNAQTAAAKLGKVPELIDEIPADGSEVRFAFDGDAVVFSAESDEIYKKHGIEAFFEHEKTNAENAMEAGPFGNFLKKLSMLREIYLDSAGFSKVRIGIVTARNAPAHERVVKTLRAWGTPADEAHFVGANAKGPILEAMAAHIFFDDQEKHVLSAESKVPAGHVPGPHDADKPIIPAG